MFASKQIRQCQPSTVAMTWLLQPLGKLLSEPKLTSAYDIKRLHALPDKLHKPCIILASFCLTFDATVHYVQLAIGHTHFGQDPLVPPGCADGIIKFIEFCSTSCRSHGLLKQFNALSALLQKSRAEQLVEGAGLGPRPACLVC